MSSTLYLQQVRSSRTDHNPYYEYFRDSIGKGDNLYYTGIGDVYSSLPEFQRGYGIVSRTVKNGSRPQLGFGIGTWLSNIFRFAQPLLKRGLKEVAEPLVSKGIREVADVASKVASDTIKGAKFTDALKKHTSKKASELIQNAPSAFSGLIRKKGAGLKVRRSAHSKVKKGILSSTNSKKRKKVKNKISYPGLELLR